MKWSVIGVMLAGVTCGFGTAPEEGAGTVIAAYPYDSAHIFLLDVSDLSETKGLRRGSGRR